MGLKGVNVSRTCFSDGYDNFAKQDRGNTFTNQPIVDYGWMYTPVLRYESGVKEVYITQNNASSNRRGNFNEYPQSIFVAKIRKKIGLKNSGLSGM